MRASLTARTLSGTALPVIDVGTLVSPRGPVRREAAAAMRAACMDRGFFYIANHGVSPHLIEQVLAETRGFFALPLAEKLALDKAKSRASRGYEPLRGQTLEAGAPPDLKEGFYIGLGLPDDDPRVRAGKFAHGPNQWPAERPQFRATMEAYFAAMLALERTLWQGLALSLELDQDYFAAFCREPIATLRLLHYPPQPAQPLPDEKGCGAHTDFGGLTILLQDDQGGLQVHDERFGWIHAPPLPGSFVVNLGDMIARWTNDRYRSTLHRVVNISGRDRYSVPFFFTGNPDYEVACLPSCRTPGEAPKYPPTIVSEHLAEMYRRTYGR